MVKEPKIDRLSLLPDCVLTDILSHLPLYSAVATSVLSRRWRNLWTHLTHLVFDTSGMRLHSRRPPSGFYWDIYIETVHGLLPHFTSPIIHSLRIQSPFVYNDETVKLCSSSLPSWIPDICNRHVEGIQVIIPAVSSSLSVPVPSCMFQCQSLTTLSLHGAFHFNDELVVSLPKLKYLDFDYHVLESQLLAKLSKSCTLLDHLSLRIDLWKLDDSLDLSTLCLKTLFIEMISHPNPPQGKLVINASKLEHITLNGLSLANICFVKSSGALVTANVSLKPLYMDTTDYHSNTVKFAELISSAKFLNLNFTALTSLITYLNDGVLPIFDNLSDLIIKFDDIKGRWNDLLLFLMRVPTLQSLTLKLSGDKRQILKWVEPHFTPPSGLTNLRRIHIKQVKGNTGDYMMMKYILSNAKALKLLSVTVCVPYERKHTILWKEYKFCDRLFLLENSSTCEIKFAGQYLNISSVGVKNKTPLFQSFRLGDRLVI